MSHLTTLHVILGRRGGTVIVFDLFAGDSRCGYLLVVGRRFEGVGSVLILPAMPIVMVVLLPPARGGVIRMTFAIRCRRRNGAHTEIIHGRFSLLPNCGRK